MGEWIEWSGGECPVKGHSGVYVTLRGGDEFLMKRPEICWWEHDGCELDILRYRVVDDEAEREPDALDVQRVKTLRDEFAMAAVAGIIANPNTPDELIGLGYKGSKDMLAQYAYALADAMLIARKESE